MFDLDTLTEQVRSFDAGDDERTQRSREQVLDLLEIGPQALRRDHFEPGHMTASAIVLSPDRQQVLLLLHARLGVWLQPGGHIEPVDPSAVAAARREAVEETAVQLVPECDTPAVLVGIDVHQIPAGRGEPAHLHHDVQYRLIAADLNVRPCPEAPEVAWQPAAALPDHVGDLAVRTGVTRALALP